MATKQAGPRLNDPIEDASTLPVPKRLLLGLQHLFTMFGSTVLVPLTTGLDVATVLLMGGVGTLICHLCTKGKVPVYLGSSFAYITPVIMAAQVMGGGADGLAYARGGVFLVGIAYIVISLLVMAVGADRVRAVFPPVVTGSIITSLGLMLAPTAIDMASENWALAIVGMATVIIVTMFFRGFVQVIPVLIAMIVGYLVSLAAGQVDLTAVKEAAWIGLPSFAAPKFSPVAIALVTPVCIATIVECFGDVAAIGETVRKDFYKDPGVHRVMLGDGIATALSAAVGGCALTTYSENTGVLALTKVWDPLVMRIAAVFAILLGFCPKVSALLQTMPGSVVGGISIILFGFVAGTGLRTLHPVNFGNSRNQIIFAAVLILCIGGAAVSFTIGEVAISFGGVALAAVVGLVLNLVLPKFGDEMLEEDGKASSDN